MPTTIQKFGWTNDELIGDAFECHVELDPDLAPHHQIDARVARLRDAQPICDVGSSAKITPVQRGIKGLQIAEDRGVAEGVRLGRDMARAISS